jgi:2-polyprenyl-3-methyl-5-hydroxy-6-metoxy-1,4-benzoquinol methylase
MVEEARILERWLKPLTLQDLAGLEVLDAGCGNGLHAALIKKAGAKSVHGIDYAAWEVAQQRYSDVTGLQFSFHDLCAGPAPGKHDLIVCLGVLPHVVDPEVAVHNMAAALKPGGRLLIWATVREGNLALYVFDRFKPLVTSWGGKRTKLALANTIALATLPGQVLASRFPVLAGALPYGRYLRELSSLARSRVVQNFYDAINAPRRNLFHQGDVTQWMRNMGLDVSVEISPDLKSRTWVGRN